MPFFKRKRRWFYVIGILVIGAGAAVFTLSGNEDEGAEVQADLAYIDDLREQVTASGRIKPQTQVEITSEVSAQVVQVNVTEGSIVEKGEPLIQLDTIQLKSDVEQARYSLDEINARLAAAKAQFEKDEKEFARQKKLYEQQLTSEQEFTDADFSFKNSRANFDAMRAQANTQRARLDKMLDNLRKTTIIAPMSGVVTYLGVEAGEIAQAQTAYTQGKTLMIVADLSVFEVEVDVDETQIAKIRLDQPAEIRVDAFRDTTFSGHVVEIGNSALVQGQGTENMATSFRVKVRFDETGAILRPGMSATVEVTTNSADDAILIPYASVVVREFEPDSLKKSTATEDNRSDNVLASSTSEEAGDSRWTRKDDDKIKRSGVYVINNSEVRFVDVETGIANETQLVALSGVNPGDTVVSGSFKTLRALDEGDRVSIDSRSLEKMKEFE